MRPFFSTIALVFSVTFASVAQNIDLPADYIRNTLSGRNDLPPNVQGSLYVEDSFQKGKVTIGDKSFDAFLRYNAYEDVFELRNQDQEVISLLRRPDIAVRIGNKFYTVEEYLEDGRKRQGYLVELADGEFSFLRKEGVELKPGVKATSTYKKDKPARLDHYSTYYIQKGNTPAKEVRLRKKDVLKEIEGEQVEKFVKKNKLKLKDEKEVIRLVQYANSLDKE